MNARQRRAYHLYKQSDMYSLYDAYGRFSHAKRDAWRYCEDLCRKYDGHGLKVITVNTSQFTAGFEFEEDGKGKFMYITKASDTVVDIE